MDIDNDAPGLAIYKWHMLRPDNILGMFRNLNVMTHTNT